MNIKPYDTQIQKLFQSAFYKIPRFQRSYSWDRGNIEEFWTDVVVSGKIGHFIGSMVLYLGKNGHDLFVVDGQQRLTTITIFLAALRDTFTEVGEPSLAKGVQGVIQRPDINSENRYVLLTETSWPYFQEHIQKHGAPDIDLKPSEEEKELQRAYQFARGGFKELVANARNGVKNLDAQKHLVKKLLERYRAALLSLNIIIIQLESEDEAYVVFETLNTRGKDLEPKDLIKTLLTKLIPAKSADVDTAKIIWNGMIKSLSESAANLDASTYLHHFWLSRFDYTPARTLYDKVKKQVKKENAREFLTSIRNDVETYRRIFEPVAYSWSTEEHPLRQSLIALNIFKITQSTPWVLSVLRAYYENKLSLKQTREALASVERFHFMYTAVAGQSSSGGVSKMYAAAGRGLAVETSEQKRAKLLQEFRTKLRTRLPDKASFDAGFSQLQYGKSDTRDRPLIRYILGKIDTHVRKDATVDYSKMTVEHIAAQNPAGGGAPVSLYATLGNLILVSEELNTSLKNKNFRQKKVIMAAATLRVDETISNATQWTNTEIEARTAALASLLHANAI